jgi:hypothetical protein
MEILDSIAAAAEFDRRARKAAIVVAEVGKLTVQEGNPGDDAVNDWIAAMMGLYRMITGKEPATSVGAPMRRNEGIAAGPLIRFLQAAGKPLEIDFSIGAHISADHPGSRADRPLVLRRASPMARALPDHRLSTVLRGKRWLLSSLLSLFFLEFSERIFSRLRNTFTDFGPLCVCYFC